MIRTFFLFCLSTLGTLIPSSAQNALPTGVSLEAVYTGDVLHNFRGGGQTGTVALSNLDLLLGLEGEALLGVEGLSALVYGLGNWGGAPSELVGDAQGVNNIEAPTTWKVYEAWAEQRFGDRATALFGLYDLNSEFDVIGAAGLFLHSSHGIGVDYSQSGPNGPSIFPTTALGLRLNLALTDQVYLQAAVLDGVPGRVGDHQGTDIILRQEEGALLAAELVWLRGNEAPARQALPRNQTPEYGTKVALGHWLYTTPMPVLQIPTDSFLPPAERSRGAYLLAEQVLLTAQRPKRVSAFVRVGMATESVNRFGTYLGGGVHLTGLFPNRSDDEVGIATAIAINGDTYQRLQNWWGDGHPRVENALELTYLAPWGERFALQGDLQYIIQPDTNIQVSNALVGGLRFTMAL